MMNQDTYTFGAGGKILAALLKAHGIRKIVVGTEIYSSAFAQALHNDSWFEICRSADERSAGYIACGMVAESGEPAVLVCAGVSSFHNYFPPLTEAYYRQLPVLAVAFRAGHSTQFLDRITVPKDCAKLSVYVNPGEDEAACAVKVNEALLELRHNGGGPVCLHIACGQESCLPERELPAAQVIGRIEPCAENFPELTAGTVGVFVGSHPKWSAKLTDYADAFCERYNGAVICGHTGNYRGRYAVSSSFARREMDLMIHIGRVSGDCMSMKPKEVWRVDPDGTIPDVLGNLRYVFEMKEEEFFARYLDDRAITGKGSEYYSALRSDCDSVRALMPELPFSSAWAAQNTAPKLPQDSVLYLDPKNSLRTWNFFELPQTVRAYADTGSFGIDGCVSSLLGASLASPEKLFFGVVDDKAFFYDMNAIGNRHKGRNLRLMVISVEKQPSSDLLRHYAEDLGFEYLCASDKEEYLANLQHFTTPEMLNKPIFFEIFTDSKNESEALSAIDGLSGGSR